MDGLKQRVIGALVLVSLAIIFVPMMFDEPHSERSSRVLDLPEEPAFPEVQPSSDAETVVSKEPAYRIEESDDPGGERQDPAKTNEAAASADVLEPQPAPDEPVQSAEADEPVSESSETSGQPESVETAEFAQTLEGAWIVQLGSFGSADNARRLRDKVREQGYDSHIQQVERGDAILSRVFSGPFVDRASADKAKKILDSEFGVNSLVTAGGG
ncbi:MAG: SPOR domain-containing protein [Oleiphilaceae bacterium]|nr:SPOR domain-containing protein [Oleiphilaceae bacterium]